MDVSILNGVGAFLSGVAAVVSAIVSARIARSRARDECDKRIEAMDKALKLGLTLERRRSAREDQ